MFRTLTRSTIATTIAAAVAIGATALPAAARTTVAFAGRAQAPADVGCFVEWFGSMTNTCSSAKWLIVPITVDPAGYHTVTVSAYGASSSNNVGCQAIGINKETTGYYGGEMRYLPVFGTATDITLPPTFVPGGGSLFLSCVVNPQGRVNLVNTTW